MAITIENIREIRRISLENFKDWLKTPAGREWSEKWDVAFAKALAEDEPLHRSD